MDNKILISGSAVEYNEFLPKEDAQNFIYKLGYKLVEYGCSLLGKEQELKIINGNGKGVGQYLYEGVAEAVANHHLDISNYLIMYPFPKIYYDNFERDKLLKEQFYEYRNNMIQKCEIVFFIFGNKYDKNNQVVDADGVREEFEIAVKQHKYVFPIGATGYVAKELANEVLNNFEKYNGNMPNIKKMLSDMNNSSISCEQIINNIISIINILSSRSNE